ncbi:MAG: hypothetical protein LBB82_09440, partial [Treponema sp.]|nr:hypothetical protein [Treponema sp.]
MNSALAKIHALVIDYDNMGRRIAMESSDMGRKTWRYDKIGNPDYESSSALYGNSIQYACDGFNRLVKIDYPLSETAVTCEYDSLYQLVAARGTSDRLGYNSRYEQTFAFDASGNMTAKTSSAVSNI